MGLTRASSGLLLYDAFSTDTSANYDSEEGTLSVSSGSIKSDTAAIYAVRTGISGVACATARCYISGVAAGGGVFLGANATLANANDVDGYACKRSTGYGGGCYLVRLTNKSSTTLASDATVISGIGYNIMRVYRSAGVVYGKMGATALTVAMSASDATYAGSLYGGFNLRYLTSDLVDWLDLRTAHTVTCSGLPAGSSVVVSDGVTTASADTAAGAVSIDAGAVLFPLTSVTVYASTGGGGAVLAQITSATLTDMGGGDAYVYAAGFIPQIMRHHFIPSLGGGIG